jgi:hypothetical protein
MIKGLRARPHRRSRQIRRRRHPRPRLRWWSHLPGLRHPSGHRQVPRRLLPEVRRRALQEPAEAGFRPVRPHTPRCRQPPRGAQEVRWSRCPRQVPEVLPLNVSFRQKKVTFGGSDRLGFWCLFFFSFFLLFYKRISSFMIRPCLIYGHAQKEK